MTGALPRAAAVEQTPQHAEEPLGSLRVRAYRGGAADSSGWTLLSGNVTLGWQTTPDELVLYFESPAVGGSYANLFVDDVTVRVLSRP